MDFREKLYAAARRGQQFALIRWDGSLRWAEVIAPLMPVENENTPTPLLVNVANGKHADPTAAYIPVETVIGPINAAALRLADDLKFAVDQESIRQVLAQDDRWDALTYKKGTDL